MGLWQTSLVRKFQCTGEGSEGNCQIPVDSEGQGRFAGGVRVTIGSGGPQKESPGAGPGLGDSVSRISGVDYLHSVGTYLARTEPAAVPVNPRLFAVVIAADVHAQSILPGLLSASGSLLTFGKSLRTLAPAT